MNMNSSSQLRQEVRARALPYAARSGLIQGVDYYESLGKKDPTVMFVRSLNNDRHPNFINAAWDVIRSDPRLLARASRAHSQRRSLPPTFQATACELDSSNSSDALLMNVFCYPGALPALAGALGVPGNVAATVGFPFTVPNEKTRDTQIDLCLGSAAICEAKLCESDFTTVPATKIALYRDFDAVFGRGAFQAGGVIKHYQLVRNVLAAYARGCDFVLLYDSRRQDLLRCFDTVVSTIRVPALAAQCRSATWQQLAAVAPKPLHDFLSEKYGI